MLKSHKREYHVRGKEGPRFWIPAYAISTVLGIAIVMPVLSPCTLRVAGLRESPMVTEKDFSEILETASQMAKIKSRRCAELWLMNRTQTDFFRIANPSKDLILTTDTLTGAESNVVSKAIQRYSTCLTAVMFGDGSVGTGSLLKVARRFRKGLVLKVGGVKPPREVITATKHAVAWFDEEKVCLETIFNGIDNSIMAYALIIICRKALISIVQKKTKVEQVGLWV